MVENKLYYFLFVAFVFNFKINRKIQKFNYICNIIAPRQKRQSVEVL